MTERGSQGTTPATAWRRDTEKPDSSRRTQRAPAAIQTAIAEETYKELSAGALEKPSKVLYGPSCHSLDVLGQFTATMQHGDYSSTQPIYVVRVRISDSATIFFLSVVVQLSRVSITNLARGLGIQFVVHRSSCHQKRLPQPRQSEARGREPKRSVTCVLPS